MYDFLPRLFIVPFFLILFLMALFLWSCRYRGAEGIHASHILLSQRTDSKEKQVINLDQDVQVSEYVWWMVYELFFMSPIFFRDMGLSLFFFFILFFWHALWACGIPSLGMHLFSFSFSSYIYIYSHNDNLGESGHGMTWSFILWMDGWSACSLLV